MFLLTQHNAPNVSRHWQPLGNIKKDHESYPSCHQRRFRHYTNIPNTATASVYKHKHNNRSGQTSITRNRLTLWKTGLARHGIYVPHEAVIRPCSSDRISAPRNHSAPMAVRARHMSSRKDAREGRDEAWSGGVGVTMLPHVSE